MKIVQYPHPALRVKAEPIISLNKEIALQAARMLDLMHEQEGLGLAAPQVALAIRMIVMTFDPDRMPGEEAADVVAINPVIVETSGTADGREGCLSFPELFQKVRRPKTIRAQAYNLKGELFEMKCSDLAARLWLHEIDHLDGILFIDKMGPLGRLSSKKYLDDFIEEYHLAMQKGEIAKDLLPVL